MAEVIRDVEPLPLVPVTCTTGYVACGLSRALKRARIRSRLGSPRLPARPDSIASRLMWRSSQERVSPKEGLPPPGSGTSGGPGGGTKLGSVSDTPRGGRRAVGSGGCAAGALGLLLAGGTQHQARRHPLQHDGLVDHAAADV